LQENKGQMKQRFFAIMINGSNISALEAKTAKGCRIERQPLYGFLSVGTEKQPFPSFLYNLQF